MDRRVGRCTASLQLSSRQLLFRTQRYHLHYEPPNQNHGLKQNHRYQLFPLQSICTARGHSSRGRRGISTIPSAPAPTCACAAMPADLEIDHKRALEGSMAPYQAHVLLPTGRSDWQSRAEDDPSLPFLRRIKALLSRGGKYMNPFHNVLVSASSFPEDPRHGQRAALLVPQFQYILPWHAPPSPDATSSNPEPEQEQGQEPEQGQEGELADNLLRGFVLPETGPADPLLLRDMSRNADLFTARPVTDALVLICGHGARDERCGVMGTLLEAEFRAKLGAPGALFPLRDARHVFGPLNTDTVSEADAGADADAQRGTSARTEGGVGPAGATVGLISHIGGHAFAGNVILYIPPSARTADGAAHPLAGRGVWYGRVEPRHVEGIVRETVERGVVIRDLFRGGIDGQGDLLRL